MASTPRARRPELHDVGHAEARGDRGAARRRARARDRRHGLGGHLDRRGRSSWVRERDVHQRGLGAAHRWGEKTVAPRGIRWGKTVRPGRVHAAVVRQQADRRIPQQQPSVLAIRLRCFSPPLSMREALRRPRPVARPKQAWTTSKALSKRPPRRARRKRAAQLDSAGAADITPALKADKPASQARGPSRMASVGARQAPEARQARRARAGRGARCGTSRPTRRTRSRSPPRAESRRSSRQVKKGNAGRQPAGRARVAAGALWNLSGNDANDARDRRGGRRIARRALVKMGTPRARGRRRALGNLAYNPENQVAIVAAGGDRALVKLVNTGTLARKNAAGVSRNLAYNNEENAVGRRRLGIAPRGSKRGPRARSAVRAGGHRRRRRTSRRAMSGERRSRPRRAWRALGIAEYSRVGRELATTGRRATRRA